MDHQFPQFIQTRPYPPFGFRGNWDETKRNKINKILKRPHAVTPSIQMPVLGPNKRQIFHSSSKQWKIFDFDYDFPFFPPFQNNQTGQACNQITYQKKRRRFRGEKGQEKQRGSTLVLVTWEFLRNSEAMMERSWETVTTSSRL